MTLLGRHEAVDLALLTDEAGHEQLAVGLFGKARRLKRRDLEPHDRVVAALAILAAVAETIGEAAAEAAPAEPGATGELREAA